MKTKVKITEDKLAKAISGRRFRALRLRGLFNQKFIDIACFDLQQVFTFNFIK